MLKTRTQRKTLQKTLQTTSKNALTKGETTQMIKTTIHRTTKLANNRKYIPNIHLDINHEVFKTQKGTENELIAFTNVQNSRNHIQRIAIIEREGEHGKYYHVHYLTLNGDLKKKDTVNTVGMACAQAKNLIEQNTYTDSSEQEETEKTSSQAEEETTQQKEKDFQPDTSKILNQNNTTTPQKT